MTASGESRAKPDSAWLRRVRCIEQFEDDWQEVGFPAIDRFLASVEPHERADLLHELIKIDLEYRWKRGDRRRLEQYAQQFPELGAAGVLPPDLIAEELQVRAIYEGELEDADRLTRRSNRTAAPADAQNDADTVVDRELPGVGRRLGRYELRERVGRGGFSTVYRAWDPELRREVAIKVPHAEYVSDEGLAARLRREATSAARLRHPAIVPIHEVAQHGETTFIVYQFIPGPTLAQTLETTRPAPQQAAAWVARLAEALDYAHQCGIVHRDVKPTNVMMGHDNQPTLADFGLALETDAAVATLTQHGDILGTPAYMSPEQAAGRGHDADARTDVYSLGVVLYEMLTGQVPFPGHSASVIHRVIHDDPPAPRRLRPGLALDLETICLKAMAKESHRRYPSAGALAEDLYRFLRHEPILARRVGAAGRLLRWCRRQPALATTIAGAIAAVTFVVLVSFNRVVGERDAARGNLYRALVDGARAESQGRDTGWWWKAMDNLAEAARLDVASRDVAALRDQVVECLGTEFPCMRVDREWAAHDGPVSCVALGPRGHLLATGSNDLSLAIWEVASGAQLERYTGHTDRLTSVAFHPSGALVATGARDGTVRLWDLRAVLAAWRTAADPDPPIARLSPTVASATNLPLSKDGLGGRSRSRAAQTTTPPPAGPSGGLGNSTASQHLQFDAGFVYAVAFSRDGRWLAAGCEDGSIRVMRVTEQGAVPCSEPLRGHSAAVRCLDFSPIDGRLASGSDDRTVKFWNLPEGTIARTWSTSNPVNTIAFASNGTTLTYGQQLGFGMSVRQLEGGYTSGSNQIHSAVITRVGWVGDSHPLSASADGAIKIWRPDGRNIREVAVARASLGAVLCADARADSAAIVASGYRDGRVRLWEVSEPAARIMLHDTTQHARFAGQQRRLIAGHDSFDFSTGLDAVAIPYVPRVSAIATHPDAELFAFARGDGDLRIAAVSDGRERARWNASRSPIRSLVSSPDGRWLASAGDDGTVRLWDWQSGRLEQSVELQSGPIDHVAWSPDGRRVAARTSLATIVWERDDPTRTRRFQLPALELTAMALGDDRLATGASDGTICVWALDSGELVQTLHGHLAAVLGLVFGPAGESLFSTSEDYTVRQWSLGSATGRVVLSAVSATRIAIDPAGRYLFVGRNGLESSIISLATGRAIRAAEVIDEQAVFAHDGSYILAVSFNGGIRVHRVEDIDLQHESQSDLVPWREVIPGGHTNMRSAVWGIATSPDGRWFATGGHDEIVKIWDVQTMQVVHSLTGHSGIVWGIGFSGDSKRLASGSSTGDSGEIIVWDVGSGGRVATLYGHTLLVSSLAFHPDGTRLASASNDGSVLLWDLRDLSADGSRCAPRLLRDFDQPVHDVAFSPDGRWLTAACEDHRVAIWKGATMDEIMQTDSPGRSPQLIEFLTGHTTPVWSVAFSRDGRYLASGADEGTIILWDAATRQRIVTLDSGTRQIRSLSFSGDGRFLAGAAYMAPTVVWDLAELRSVLARLGLDWRDPRP